MWLKRRVHWCALSFVFVGVGFLTAADHKHCIGDPLEDETAFLQLKPSPVEHHLQAAGIQGSVLAASKRRTKLEPLGGEPEESVLGPLYRVVGVLPADLSTPAPVVVDMNTTTLGVPQTTTETLPDPGGLGEIYTASGVSTTVWILHTTTTSTLANTTTTAPTTTAPHIRPNFNISVDKEEVEGGQLGMIVSYDLNEKLNVIEIEDQGAVQDWNLFHSATPDEVVIVGDKVIAVNNLTDARSMMDELKNATKLNISFQPKPWEPDIVVVPTWPPHMNNQEDDTNVGEFQTDPDTDSG